MDDIHRPHSTEQSGEDWSYSTSSGPKSVGKEKLRMRLDSLVGAFEAAWKRLMEVADKEIDQLRDRLRAMDDALLKEKL